MQIYYQMSTRNKSFLDMHIYLKSIGIKNNKFMLALLDPDLAAIDPHDPNLNQYYKGKVLAECMANFWYFIREVCRVPDQGGSGTGIPFRLHRGNMALFFCSIYNMNIFHELPRQQGKTLAADARYLYLFNFGTSNATIAFLHKAQDGSKDNLQTLKNLRECLPPYLRMDAPFNRKDGKAAKASDTVLRLEHAVNRNKIITVASARNKTAAQNLLRGKSIPLLWGDEWGFAPYNEIIYLNTVPAFKRAADNSRANGAPYGILFTTTPGFLTSQEGVFAFQMKEDAVPFSETWYDKSYQEIMEIMESNTKSTFVYIKFTYQQLGCSEQWFKEICRTMNNKWEDIRREVLLEWSNSTDNSPFTLEELETMSRLTREPTSVIDVLNGKFQVNLYDTIEYNRNGLPVDPPIMGVDVSGGYRRDSSAISIIDSKTTKVIADFKCNYISQIELAKIIVELTQKYMRNVVINVERNGGFGASVIALLRKAGITNNLYYEFKDKIIEERFEGPGAIKRIKQITKVFGLDSTKGVRELLMEILKERMDNHKDKFVSKRLYDEFLGLEVKRNGKIEHSTNTHDDLTFSYLMALYVWYEGKNLKEAFGINKTVLKTDEDVDDIVFDAAVETVEIYEETIQLQKDLAKDDPSELSPMDKLKDAQRAIGMTYHEWIKAEDAKEKEALETALQDPQFLKAYAYKYNLTKEDVDLIRNQQDGKLPDQAFISLYSNDTPTSNDSHLSGNLSRFYNQI